MLKRNFYLEPSETKVGKRVYARGRPDMVGIITAVDTVTPGPPNTPNYSYLQIKVYYVRSKRTSKWLEAHWKFCDFDAYYRECNNIYTQGELLSETLKQGGETLRKKNGNQVR